MTNNAFQPINLTNQKKVTEQPLLGVTILLIEDSKYFSDAVRLLCINSGARLRRANCLESAWRHIRIYRPDVILVDLGLPDGSGLDFISEIKNSNTAPPMIVISGESNGEIEQESLDAGAVLFIQKPLTDLAMFQQTILSILPNHLKEKPFQPRFVGKKITPVDSVLHDDIDYIKTILEPAITNQDNETLIYCEKFLLSIARTYHDTKFHNSISNFLKSEKTMQNWQKTHKQITKLIDSKETIRH